MSKLAFLNVSKEGVKTVADLKIKSATILSDIRRDRMMARVWQDNNTDKDGNKTPLTVDDDTYYLNIHIFPALVCCTDGTITVDGKEVDYHDFNVFKVLDRGLYKQWRDEVAKINPDYLGLTSDTPVEQEKKV